MLSVTRHMEMKDKDHAALILEEFDSDPLMVSAVSLEDANWLMVLSYSHGAVIIFKSPISLS